MAPLSLPRSLDNFAHNVITTLNHLTQRDAMATSSHLGKRDNMGFAIPPMAIIVLIIFGAALLVCMCYAVHLAFGFPGAGSENAYRARSGEQEDYMREVRARNLEGLWSGLYGKRDMATGRDRTMPMKRVDSEWSDRYSGNVH